jgi:hypothetical protein
MNYARLGDIGQADHWFDKGAAWMEKWDPQYDPNNRGGRFPSTDVMEQYVPGYSDLVKLHKEAAEVLKQSRAQAEK